MQLQKISVLKIGGSLLDSRIFPRLISALVPYLKTHKTVLVHGGGKEITESCNAAGIKSKFVQGRRFTDKKTMEIAQMVLCKKLNPWLVKALKKNGLKAVGLNGLDQGLVKARKISSLGCVGVPEKVRQERIVALLQQGFCPVFASLASNHAGSPLNVNADEMASAIAKALRAERLILFTDVPGILDFSGTAIPQVVLSRGQSLLAKRIVSGGMIPKLNSALAALRAGVKEVWILQGRIPLSSAQGTVLTRGLRSPAHPFT